MPPSARWGLRAVSGVCRTGQGMAAAGGLPPEAAVPLQACGGTRGGRAGIDGGIQAAGEKGGRGIALLDIRQCCDGDTQKHRYGGDSYGCRQFIFR